MNKDAKFNAEMTNTIRRVIRDSKDISKKFDKDPYAILKIIGMELTKLADQQQQNYMSTMQAMDTLKNVLDLADDK